MMWRLMVFLMVLSSCGQLGTFPKVSEKFDQKIEAEASPNKVFGIAYVNTCSVCSGGKMVDSLGWSGYLRFPVTVPVKGLYELRMQYSFDMNETRYGLIRVNDYPAVVVSLEKTGGWGIFKQAIAQIPLQQGLNNIEITNPNNWFALLDFVVITNQLSELQSQAQSKMVLPSQPVFVLADISDISTPLAYLGFCLICGLALLIYMFWKFKSDSLGIVQGLRLIVFGCTLTLVGYLLELLDATFYGSWVGFNARLMFLCLSSVYSISFALRYTGVWFNLSSLVPRLLWFYVAFCLFVYMSDPWLHLTNIHPNLTLERHYIPFRKDDEAPGHLIAYVLSAMLMFGAMGVFVSIWNRVSGLYRTQMLYLIAALLSPFLFGYLLAYPLTRQGIASDLAWNMFGVGMSIIILGFAVFRTKLGQISPALWGQAAHIPSDLAIVTNLKGEVIEANHLARQLLKLEPSAPLGQAFSRNDDATVFWNDRHYQITRSNVQTQKHIGGELITLHDVTERALAEMALRDNQKELLSLQEELREHALRDVLTGLYNRRYLEQELETAIQEARAFGQDLSLILFDIDLFRDVNARFGYGGGDTVLRAIGSFLLNHKPESASVCRYGGEEFCALLPNTTLDEAEQLALEWQSLLAFETIVVEQARVTVRISAACASLLEHGAENLLLAADDALREAKRKGRNRVIRAQVWNPQWGKGWL
jgi:diguanylate cyclase (GGDEF)-like protein